MLWIPPFLGAMTEGSDGRRLPVPNAVATFYAAGTSTLQAVYTTRDKTVGRANPYTSDDQGIWGAVHLDDALVYRIKVTDANGVTIADYDGVGGASAAVETVDAEAGASYAFVSGDLGHLVKRTHSSTMADTLPTAASVGNGWYTTTYNASSYAQAVTVVSAGTINGASSFTLQPGQWAKFVSDGSGYFTAPTPLATGKRLLASFDASGLNPATTTPCASLVKVEFGTNDVDVDVLDFDATTQEYAYGSLGFSDSYQAGSLEYRARWTVASGSAGETLTVGAQARCFGDDDAIDQAWGTAAEVSDAVIATGDEHVTAWTAITPANDGAGRKCRFRVYRKGSTGTHAADLRLTGIEFRGILNKSNDA